MTTALEGGEGSASRPGRSLPPGKNRYPLYRRLVGPQGQSGQVWKISPPLGFDPRTVQPVASRYTDYATRPTPFLSRCSIMHLMGFCSAISTRLCECYQHQQLLPVSGGSESVITTFSCTSEANVSLFLSRDVQLI